MFKKFGLTCLFLACFGHGLAIADTLEISFGSLYGSSRDSKPTTIVGGSGELYEELKDSEFFWLCLDNEISRGTPTGIQTFNVGTDSDILTNGIWGTRTDGKPPLQENAAAILGAIANIYYNFESDILADLSGAGDQAGHSFQSAAWALTTGYSYGLWQGELTSEGIEATIGWYDPLEEEPLFRAYMRSALNGTAAQGMQVYFGNVVVGGGNDPDLLYMQSVMLFKVDTIPEPSSVLLMLGAAGAIGIFSRRRMRLLKK